MIVRFHVFLLSYIKRCILIEHILAISRVNGESIIDGI